MHTDILPHLSFQVNEKSNKNQKLKSVNSFSKKSKKIVIQTTILTSKKENEMRKYFFFKFWFQKLIYNY